MARVPKNPILELYRVLYDHTDETHSLTKKDILANMDMEISDDSFTKYRKQLNEQMPFIEIESSGGRYAEYKLATRLFKISELKLMIDAINSSSVIDQKSTEEIVRKLRHTASRLQEYELERNSTGVNKAKNQNDKLLDNIEQIQKAFKQGVQIEFDYMDWTPKKILVKKERKYPYSIEPWNLFWCNDRYYLFGYDTYIPKGGSIKIRNYRVDKMANIKLLGEKRKYGTQFDRFNPDSYVAEHMGMFGDNVRKFVVEVPKYLVGAFIDQFGRDIRIDELDDEKCRITFRSADSNIVLGWLIGLGEVEIIEDDNVEDSIKQKMIALLEKNMGRLDKKD